MRFLRFVVVSVTLSLRLSAAAIRCGQVNEKPLVLPRVSGQAGYFLFGLFHGGHQDSNPQTEYSRRLPTRLPVYTYRDIVSMEENRNEEADDRMFFRIFGRLCQKYGGPIFLVNLDGYNPSQLTDWHYSMGTHGPIEDGRITTAEILTLLAEREFFERTSWLLNDRILNKQELKEFFGAHVVLP
ncbi:MAG: hypothetical protein C5B49_03675 [Bdellovibrio sp.]|nr:MAG: hypothetical protein C5B49_03675 [Bdellovibrio sp.]